MRIVVSGTHASGKSTLISDFASRHRGFTVLPDPFDLVEESADAPGASMFARQLRVAADRLSSGEFAGDVIAERGPLDFYAYLLALDDLAGGSVTPEMFDRSAQITAAAHAHVDLLVILPLSSADPIDVGDDEHLELRAAMNDVLLELVDDADLVGRHTRVVEIVGDRDERRAALEAFIEASVF